MRIWLPVLALLCILTTEALADGSGGPPIFVDETGNVVPAAGTPAADPVGTVRSIIAAIPTGGWRLIISGGLALLMVGGIRLRVRLFGTTDRGKAIAVMSLALLGVFSAALATSTPLSTGLVWGSLGVAFTAVGARQWLSRLLWPADGGSQWFEWAKPFLGR